MTPWRLDEQQQESTVSRRSRYAVATLLVGGAIMSLFISPMSWPLFLVYTCLGIVAGLLGSLDQPGGFLAVAILLFGVGAVATALNRAAPQWHAEWWQPVLIAVAASVVIGAIRDHPSLIDLNRFDGH